MGNHRKGRINLRLRPFFGRRLGRRAAGHRPRSGPRQSVQLRPSRGSRASGDGEFRRPARLHRTGRLRRPADRHSRRAQPRRNRRRAEHLRRRVQRSLPGPGDGGREQHRPGRQHHPRDRKLHRPLHRWNIHLQPCQPDCQCDQEHRRRRTRVGDRGSHQRVPLEQHLHPGQQPSGHHLARRQPDQPRGRHTLHGRRRHRQ